MMIDTSPKYSGEPTAQALANGLATLGRYGDDYMVHAAEGETVVPKEILEANPGLKQDLFRQMTMMGIEDPNRYVVGNELNSLNPITGQPEFFFKKIFKAVKNVAKKILPIAAPIIGNLIAPGIGGILASGLTSKLTGGSWGDAMKSMALSYGAGALGRGIMGATGGRGFSGFTEGLGRGLTEPFTAASNLSRYGAANPLAQGILGPRGADLAFSNLSRSNFAKQPFGGGKGIWNKIFPEYDPYAYGGMPDIRLVPARTVDKSTLKGGAGDDLLIDRKLPPGVTRKGDKLFFDGREIVRDIPPGFTAAPEAKKAGLINRLGQFVTGGKLTGTPATLAGTGVAGLGLYAGAKMLGLTEAEASMADQLSQLDAANPRRAAFEKWKTLDRNSDEARRLKAIWYGNPQYTEAQLQSSFGANPLQGITSGTPSAPLTAAGGGEVMGPGSGTSDSIPAMLSDGEFVMTARAVRNAGGGDRSLGAARMYDMMNRFEQGAA